MWQVPRHQMFQMFPGSEDWTGYKMWTASCCFWLVPHSSSLSSDLALLSASLLISRFTCLLRPTAASSASPFPFHLPLGANRGVSICSQCGALRGNRFINGCSLFASHFLLRLVQNASVCVRACVCCWECVHRSRRTLKSSENCSRVRRDKQKTDSECLEFEKLLVLASNWFKVFFSEELKTPQCWRKCRMLRFILTCKHKIWYRLN